MRAQTPTPNVADLLTGHERRGGHWCWRPRGTPTALLVHTRSGGGVLRGGGNERTISTGETVLWAPGAPQDFGCHRAPEPWELVWAHFRPRERWHDWLMWPMLDAGIAHIPAPPATQRVRIDDALLEMDRHARSGLRHAADLALNALERAVLWLDSTTPSPQQLDHRVEEAIRFIVGHLDGPISVRAVADAVHLSPSRLTHLFRQQAGTPPARFIELRRIQRAQTLLESSSLPIGAVARATGFSSQFYFSTRFKAVTGTTPSGWRRRATQSFSQRS